MAKYQHLILLGLLFGLAVFIGITLLSDVRQIAVYARAFPWWIMIPVLALRCLNWALRWVKWHFYLDLVGVRGVSVPDSAAIFVSGFPLSASPGKAAEILKSFVLKNLYHAPIPATLPVVAAERLSDGIAVVILVAWALLNLPAASAYWAVVALSVIGLAALIGLLQFRRLCIALLNRISRLPVIGRFARAFELFYESSYRIVRLRNIVVAVGLGTLANTLDGLGVYLLLVALGLPATPETFFQALLVISLSVIAGSISGLPGGIGASDLTITGSLIAVVSLQPSEAGFVTLLARFVQLWWGVLVGSAVAFAYRRRLFPPSIERVIAEEERHSLPSHPTALPEA